uniref:Ars binding protein n=1 Tax=Colletotrichum fructicola (strain Nara gc5) TaxID=1213859 RepID=L2G2E3_COLFN
MISPQQQHQHQHQHPTRLHGQSPSPSMAHQHHLPLATTAPLPPPSSSSMTARSTLPDRNVTAATIEEAYVQFVLHCNPAVPAETDTAALREAFRVPPKSGGKSFSTFTLFQLIRQLETKEIKTWAELALKLGVEPPDQDKGQSSQKIQQYAVRLKRWMHSMHVDAFFEYLMDHPHPYWTEIPDDPTPVCEAGRDGVMAEDDMALRALLPHIKPRRGRKRPEDDDLAKSPSQRARIDSPPIGNGYRENLGSWSAHPDGRATFGCSDPLKLSANTASASGWPQAPDAAQTPLSAYPQGPMSAITPSTNRNAFWGEAEPSPPMNKANVDGPFVAFPAEGPAYKKPSPENKSVETPITPAASITQNTPPDMPQDYYLPRIPQMPRPAKPSISLQVPDRPGGAVRLATPPPPVVMVNDLRAQETAPDVLPAVKGNEPPPLSNDIPVGMFENMEDRTNIEAVLGYFTEETANGEWVDQDNNPIEGCSMAEASALVHTTVERMWQTAPNQDAFLINLAALAGGRALMTTSKLKVKREMEYEDRATYSCAWEFRMGSIRGNYNMVQTVMYNRWKKTEEEKDRDKPAEKATIGGVIEPESGWEQKYRDLLAVSERRDKELQDLRSGLVSTLSKTFKDAKELDEKHAKKV